MSSELLTEIDYPSSDGKPMGETDLHRDWMVYHIEVLKYRYRGQRVYVSGDLLVYYVEGNPKKFIVPDSFVVLDCDSHRRRIFKIWEERRVPNVVFETTSGKTRKSDEIKKPKIYVRIGVQEYFMFDPTSDYLNPPLQGFRLDGTDYRRIEPDAKGFLECRELEILLRLDENNDLEMFDSQTGERLMTEAEANEAERKKEAQARKKEAQARRDAEQEIDRLRQRLKDAGLEP